MTKVMTDASVMVNNRFSSVMVNNRFSNERPVGPDFTATLQTQIQALSRTVTQ